MGEVHQYGPLRGKLKATPKRAQPARSYRIFGAGNQWSFTFTDKIHPANTRTYDGFKSRAEVEADIADHRQEFKRIEAEIDARDAREKGAKK